MDRNIYKDAVGQSEEALQQKCYFWFHNNYEDLRGLLFHVPNGGSRNAREGAKFKMLGVVAGVADLLFMFNGTVYCLELKTETGGQSKVQESWEKKVVSQNFDYFVIRSLDDFKKTIKDILKKNEY